MSRSQAEFRLACFVADTLRRFAVPDVVWTHFPAGEKRPSKIVKGKRISPAGQRLKRMGTLPGVADYMFLWRSAFGGAEVCFLELKAKGGRLSPNQLAFKDRVLAAGCYYEVADNGQAAIEILQSWGILSQRVRVAV